MPRCPRIELGSLANLDTSGVVKGKLVLRPPSNSGGSSQDETRGYQELLDYSQLRYAAQKVSSKSSVEGSVVIAP